MQAKKVLKLFFFIDDESHVSTLKSVGNIADNKVSFILGGDNGKKKKGS